MTTGHEHISEARLGGQGGTLRGPGLPHVPEAPPAPLPTPDRPKSKGKVAAATIATVSTIAGVATLFAVLSGRGGSADTSSNPDSTVPSGAAGSPSPDLKDPTPSPTATVEATPKPEIKSTPYKLINEKTYANGRLKTAIGEDLPGRTEFPANLYSADTTKKVSSIGSNGIEINENIPNAEEDTFHAFEVGLLIAWGTQNNIPDEDKDLIITAETPKEIQLEKVQEMKERAKAGKSYPLTILAFKDDKFAEEAVTMDLGKEWTFHIDQPGAGVNQIIWSTTTGSSVRVSPENLDFRIEFTDLYAGGVGVFSEKIFIAYVLGTTLAHLPELIPTDGTPSTEKNRPSLGYVTGLGPKIFQLSKNYLIPGIQEGTYGKDWPDSTILPIP